MRFFRVFWGENIVVLCDLSGCICRSMCPCVPLAVKNLVLVCSWLYVGMASNGERLSASVPHTPPGRPLDISPPPRLRQPTGGEEGPPAFPASIATLGGRDCELGCVCLSSVRP